MKGDIYDCCCFRNNVGRLAIFSMFSRRGPTTATNVLSNQRHSMPPSPFDVYGGKSRGCITMVPVYKDVDTNWDEAL